MSNVSANAAKAHADGAGVGILRYQRSKGVSADVHIDAAHDYRIGAGAKDIALPCDITFFHQVGDMYGYGGLRDACLFCKLLMRDHRVCFDPLEDLSLSLCHNFHRLALMDSSYHTFFLLSIGKIKNYLFSLCFFR